MLSFFHSVFTGKRSREEEEEEKLEEYEQPQEQDTPPSSPPQPPAKKARRLMKPSTMIFAIGQSDGLFLSNYLDEFKWTINLLPTGVTSREVLFAPSVLVQDAKQEPSLFGRKDKCHTASIEALHECGVTVHLQGVFSSSERWMFPVVACDSMPYIHGKQTHAVSAGMSSRDFESQLTSTRSSLSSRDRCVLINWSVSSSAHCTSSSLGVSGDTLQLCSQARDRLNCFIEARLRSIIPPAISAARFLPYHLPLPLTEKQTSLFGGSSSPDPEAVERLLQAAREALVVRDVLGERAGCDANLTQMLCSFL